MNVEDIIAQYKNDSDNDVDVLGDTLNIEDLLNDDLTASVLQSPQNDHNDTTNDDDHNRDEQQTSKPSLSSTLPPPTINPHSVLTHDTTSELGSGSIEPQIDIESILKEDALDGDTHDNDALLDFDPYNLNLEDMKQFGNSFDGVDSAQASSNHDSRAIRAYTDIDLDSIESLLKREEIRVKQRMECGNYALLEPLTKRRQNSQVHGDEESFFKLELRASMTKTLEHHKQEYGPPNVVKSHRKFIAMGMKNGTVFIFDHFEQLKVELTPQDARSLRMGSVTALDFNHNGTTLVAGYHGGQLILWDIINKKELKKIRDAHSAPVIFVMFYRRGAFRIASADSKGVMFTWNISKILFSYQVDRSSLFNGKRAGVLYDLALYAPNPNHSHVLDPLALCAVANHESVFFVTLEPPVTLKQTIILPNTSMPEIKRGALPMLAWRLAYGVPKNTAAKKPTKSRADSAFSTTASQDGRRTPSPSPPPPYQAPPPPPGAEEEELQKRIQTLNPVLAVGSGTVIQLIEVFVRDEAAFTQQRDQSMIKMRGIGQIQLDQLVIALRWLNEENLVILTANDEICICSGYPMQVAEKIWPQQPPPHPSSSLVSPLSKTYKPTQLQKISMDFFIRHQYFGKSIICFKNCLEIVAGLDRTGHGNRLMMTTNTNVVTAHCMTWHDRIDKLTREGEWIKACCLILEFSEQYEKGLIANTQSVRNLCSKLDGYIVRFCEFVVQSSQISDDELESFGGVAMDYCVCLGRTGDLLFDRVYNILRNHGGREIFFKLLEPYILNDRITTLPPEFMRNFAEFMVSRDKNAELEQVILHLSPHSFDIHQMVSICRQQRLFLALCHLYNCACLDYGEPITDMFYRLMNENAAAKVKENESDLMQNWTPLRDQNVLVQRGYQLMLYLKYTMNASTFPWCHVLRTPLKAKQQILHVLFDGAQQYKILRHLLALDLQVMLFQILKIAFEEQHLFRSASSSTSMSPKTSAPQSPALLSSTAAVSAKHRRTSIQMRGILFNAQSAVMSGAKWAWSAATLSNDSPSNLQSTVTRTHVPAPMDASIPDQVDPNLAIKSKQEMLNVLVKIIIDEENSALAHELKSVKQSEKNVFYEFCTPLLASGECEVDIALLQSVVQHLFAEAEKMLARITKQKQMVQYQKKTTTTTTPQQQQEENLTRMERELQTLLLTQNNFENTILILLSRKMERNKQAFDIAQLIAQCKQCSFHKIELYLHRENGDHAAVIDSYLADKDLRAQVFDYINNLFYDIRQEIEALNAANNDQYVVNPHPNNDLVTPQNRRQSSSSPASSASNTKFFAVVKIVLTRLAPLVRISAEQSAELVFQWFPQYFEDTVKTLGNARKLQHVFLQTIVTCTQTLHSKQLDNSSKHRTGLMSVTAAESMDSEFDTKLQRTENTNLTNLEKLLAQHTFTFSQKVHELYIRLLCEFEKESVLAYISDYASKFDIQLTERYCEKFQVLDASAYLKERSGDIIGALQLILKSIDNAISNLWDVFKSDFEAKKITASNVKNNSYYINCDKVTKIGEALTMAIGLCQRHNDDESKMNLLWNNLLDACLKSQQKISTQIKTPAYRTKYASPEIRHLMKQTVNDIVSRILQAMMTEKNIDLVDIFNKLVDKESSEKYEYYKDTIDLMLSTYKYETQMLKTANNLFRNGFYNTYKHEVNTAGAAYKYAPSDATHTKSCNICDSSISDIACNRLRIFYCGHLFHEHCLYSLQKKKNQRSMSVYNDDEHQLCPICYLNTDLKLEKTQGKNEKQQQLMEEQQQRKVEQQSLIQMRNYAKKLQHIQQRVRRREEMNERASQGIRDRTLQLQPANKAAMPRSTKPIDMHVPAANWDAQFVQRKTHACLIEID